MCVCVGAYKCVGVCGVGAYMCVGVCGVGA